jgi:hypothetical protein
MTKADWYKEAHAAAWAAFDKQEAQSDRRGIKGTIGAVLRRLPLARDLMFLRDLRHSSYLARSGWFESVSQRMAVDQLGEPLPWLTYAAITFLAPRLQPGWSVFEFGCGNSTLWWAARVARVFSCEHDAGWAEGFRRRCPANVSLLHRELTENGAYAQATAEFNAEFNVIVIDGRDRVNCASHCLAALKPDGVIIWDNSEREKYKPGYDLLAANGFRRIDFSGLGPVNVREWQTTIFYRPDNCLGI